MSAKLLVMPNLWRRVDVTYPTLLDGNKTLILLYTTHSDLRLECPARVNDCHHFRKGESFLSGALRVDVPHFLPFFRAVHSNLQAQDIFSIVRGNLIIYRNR
jgi:hypothetical protein